ncbi:hypothetical protein CcI156_06545 [Frankia sp. CcI156]|uniref:DUF3499 domain-containing protein n=1 Tax=Frankia TaxID=1854 RepID=UPI0003F94E60|nr:MULTISPECIES: DUF3499 domain-containing protein [Frankia]EYT93997.1 hypothetical protein ThrDRAFT_00368 [Frankia casuarinae]KDA44622.1 hypothetical protein BMG523Draft_00472 [Frankia sp. BMG5.23]KEZ38494.1 Protein of unknown function (DUF3499) [Frankia sp. CeD]OHV47686.1 hypothetical protein CgIS1_06820 [Frankia sp. CgIS1]ONH27883.1 hypothetical protein CcI156_06545 [Frankia sp. CcI156]
MKPRRCSRSACSAAAVATLTYAYAESTAVLGPLSPYVEPHSYDLCGTHADRLTVPLGWAVVRLEAEAPREGGREVAGDDLEALADAVREASRRGGPEPPQGPQAPPPGGRRGHLRAVPSPS